MKICTLSVGQDVRFDSLAGSMFLSHAIAIFENKIFIAVTKDMFGSSIVCEVYREYEKYRDVVDRDLIFYIASDPAAALVWLFDSIERENPEVIAMWNMAFDGKIMEQALAVSSEGRAVELSEMYRFSRGDTFVRSIHDDTIRFPIHPSEQSPKISVEGLGQFIDAMTLHRQLRMSEPREDSYIVRKILAKHSDYVNPIVMQYAPGVDGHRAMQNEDIVKYLLWNAFSDIGIIELNKVTGDIEKHMADLKESSKE